MTEFESIRKKLENALERLDTIRRQRQCLISELPAPVIKGSESVGAAIHQQKSEMLHRSSSETHAVSEMRASRSLNLPLRPQIAVDKLLQSKVSSDQAANDQADMELGEIIGNLSPTESKQQEQYNRQGFRRRRARMPQGDFYRPDENDRNGRERSRSSSDRNGRQRGRYPYIPTGP